RILRGLDEEHLAAERRPREPGGDARLLRLQPRLREVAALAQQLARLGLGHRDLALRLALGEVPRHLAADRAELALEVADPRLARVLDDHDVDRVVLDLDL